ncbi:MAG: MarC family protein, partial [Rhodospirillales bacterium]|nr:MarC family protein [Rhodospirillales bacterium]
METALAAFLLSFPALFSIINPLGGAIIFHEVTSEQGTAQRQALARRVAVYSFLVMMSALLAG